jgi:ABC-type multidrug transport system fused ATPase/permease subunit
VLEALKILARRAQTKMDNELESHLRKDLFNRVLHQSPSFFKRFNPAQLTNVLTLKSVEAQQAVLWWFSVKWRAGVPC